MMIEFLKIFQRYLSYSKYIFLPHSQVLSISRNFLSWEGGTDCVFTVQSLILGIYSNLDLIDSKDSSKEGGAHLHCVNSGFTSEWAICVVAHTFTHEEPECKYWNWMLWIFLENVWAYPCVNFAPVYGTPCWIHLYSCSLVTWSPNKSLGGEICLAC